MSIFGSLPSPDDDEHADDCGIWIKDDDCWSQREKSFCTCGQPDAPIVYQGSHVLPSDDDDRGGWVDLAEISSHITRDGRDDSPSDSSPWPYLRFGVNESTVILTRRNVASVVETLNAWLERTA